MFEALLNRLKESLEELTALFGGFTSVFTTFMQLAAGNDTPDEQEEETPTQAKRR